MLTKDNFLEVLRETHDKWALDRSFHGPFTLNAAAPAAPEKYKILNLKLLTTPSTQLGVFLFWDLQRKLGERDLGLQGTTTSRSNTVLGCFNTGRVELQPSKENNGILQHHHDCLPEGELHQEQQAGRPLGIWEGWNRIQIFWSSTVKYKNIKEQMESDA
ncbi:hypothetical protein VTN00DRAFT_4895 [Thermoascus crustaceus]|uniref:uncharacterized protein n=1 Tax=Thermoascus crustaceus TaxID=5088 RepID=UPI0037449D5B